MSVDLECLGRTPDGSVRIIYNMFGTEVNIVGVFRLIDDSEVDITSLPLPTQDSLFDQCVINNKINNP